MIVKPDIGSTGAQAEDVQRHSDSDGEDSPIIIAESPQKQVAQQPVPEAEQSPRRSRRTTHKPRWQTSGDYVMYQCQHAQTNDKPINTIPEWLQKANFLVSLSHDLENVPDNVCQTILNIVNNS